MEYRITKENNTTILAISGELDALTVPELRPELNRIANADIGNVILDATGLRLIEPGGTGTIISFFKQLRAKGRKFEVKGVQGQPLEKFRELHLDTVFNIPA